VVIHPSIDLLYVGDSSTWRIILDAIFGASRSADSCFTNTDGGSTLGTFAPTITALLLTWRYAGGTELRRLLALVIILTWIVAILVVGFKMLRIQKRLQEQIIKIGKSST